MAIIPEPSYGIDGERPALEACGRVEVMVLEDDPAQQVLYREMAAAWSLPVRLTLVSSGYAAMNALSDQMPDVLITDLRMAGIDGFDVIRTLRNAVRKLAPVPVIVVTGMDIESVRRRRGMPADVPVLRKPVASGELERQVKLALAGSEAKRV
ncbi:MAG: hypothetical protein C3F19_15365 [Rhodocyclales bacterium]|nr:MAG: hypothetical protein C3F19_15365 [Rhodocyclales bacterium]